MSRYQPLFYRGSPASIPQVVAHLQKTLTEEDPNYTPLRQKMPPASIPDIVAHIQKYLTENQFVSVDELGAALAAYLEEHPEVVGVASINGETGNVIMDAGDIPLETGEDPTVAGAISYLSSALALLTTEAVQSVNGISPGTGQNVTITGANITIDASTERTLDSTFSGATSEAAGAKGLVPGPGIGDQNKVLSGSGAWVDFPVQTVQKVCNVSPDNNHNVPLKGTDIPLQSMSLVTVKQAIDNLGNTFTGATAQAAGTKGLVPAPTTQDVGKFLSAGGGWATPSGGGDVQTVNNVSPDGNGNVALKGSDIPVSSADSTKIDAALSTLNQQIGDLHEATFFLPDIVSLADLKSRLLTVANGMDNRTNKLVGFFISTDSSPFVLYATYIGNVRIVAKFENNLFFSCDFTSNKGDLIIVSYDNGVWFINNLNTVETGTVTPNGITIEYNTSLQKLGKLVLLAFEFRPNSNMSNWDIIATIPEGFRPSKEMFAGELNYHGYFQINSNGSVQTSTGLTAGYQYRSMPLAYFI